MKLRLPILATIRLTSLLIGSFLIGSMLLFTPSVSRAADQQCTEEVDASRFYSDSWGIDIQNSRFQTAENTSVNAGNVARLELAWVFGLDEGSAPHSYPMVTNNTVFIGAGSSNLYALDRNTGCTRWRFEADGDIRTAIEHGEITVDGKERAALFFGTFKASAYAIDAVTGQEIWRRTMDPHLFSMLTGSLVFDAGVLYVPVSAYEVIAAVAPIYDCCDFRGSVVALNASTGEEIWRRYTIEEEAEVTSTNWLIFNQKGPSGAPVWQSPTIDRKRNRLYFATGENYSDPATDTSDSVFSVDMKDGRVDWHNQFTEGDAWNAACDAGMLDGNCPNANGPDLDFGAPPILTVTKSGKDILLAGQKSSVVHAMDPDNGEILWQQRVGRGGKLGGIHWGMAVNQELGLLYVPVSDRNTGPPHDHEPYPGLHAINIEDGSPVWSVAEAANCDNKEGCFAGVSAAIIVTRDLLIAAGLDGNLHGFNAETGETLWNFDSWRSFEAVNGIETSGGAVDVHGPMLAGDMLFITSGYESFGQQGGNAFLAFRLKPENP